MRKIAKIETGNFMCDGGAVFGVIPKVLWQKQYPSDDKNFVNLAMRCLLIDDGERVVLIDNGIGNKQSEKFYSHYHLNGEATIEKSLNEAGYNFEDITDMVLTHLHFDHCGYSVKRTTDNNLVPVFPNANYWVSQNQWNNYLNPNIREGAVYFKENMMPIWEAGQLKIIDQNTHLMPGVELRLYDGHTPGQIIPFIKGEQRTMVYMGDLIPLMASVPLAWVSAYDTDPLKSIEEKQAFLEEAADNGYFLFFEHDINTECCTVEKTEKGILPKADYQLEQVIPLL